MHLAWTRGRSRWNFLEGRECSFCYCSHNNGFSFFGVQVYDYHISSLLSGVFGFSHNMTSKKFFHDLKLQGYNQGVSENCKSGQFYSFVSYQHSDCYQQTDRLITVQGCRQRLKDNKVRAIRLRQLQILEQFHLTFGDGV